MRILALDLSKRAAGWALWAPGDVRPASGVWVLGSEYTSRGATFARLHGEMSGLHALGGIDAVFYETPLNLGPHAGNTNADTISVLIGLAMHAESWADAIGCRIIRAVNQVTWRRHFLGPMRRGTKSATLKELALERCRQLGLRAQRHDQAEALGILDYAADALGLRAPWREDNVLLPPLAVPA